MFRLILKYIAGHIQASFLKIPQSSYDCGLYIIDTFKTNKELNQKFAKTVSTVKTAFPTLFNQNKFVVGISVEYLFVECFNRVYETDIVRLCHRNETRNDVLLFDQFKYSIKYSTPNKSGNPSNVRLINKRTNNVKTYKVDEDILIIIPSFEVPEDYIYNFKTRQLCNKKTAATKKLLKSSSIEYIKAKEQERFTGKMVYIPKQYIKETDLHQSQDGIELKSSFIRQFIEDENNAKYICSLDIRKDFNAPRCDIVKIGIEHVTGEKLLYCDS